MFVTVGMRPRAVTRNAFRRCCSAVTPATVLSENGRFDGVKSYDMLRRWLSWRLLVVFCTAVPGSPSLASNCRKFGLYSWLSCENWSMPARYSKRRRLADVWRACNEIEPLPMKRFTSSVFLT